MIITNHAYKRAKERLGLNEIQLVRLANEAWESKEPIRESFLKGDNNMNNHGFTTYEYRSLNKNIFCYQLQDGIPCLLSVYPKPKVVLPKWRLKELLAKHKKRI